MRKLFWIIVVFGIFMGTFPAALTGQVRTWDESESAFTTILDNAEPIDKFLSRTTSSHASTTVGNIVYIAFTQSDGTKTHVYLARVNRNDVEVWDDDFGTFGGWNSHLQTADPIDATNDGQASKNPAIASDSEGNVYISYLMEDTENSGNFHLYLSRFNAVTQRMEIYIFGSMHDWTTIRTDASHLGDGIDAEGDTTGQTISGTPGMVVNRYDDVFIAYLQSDGTQNHLYLARYDASAGIVEGWDTATSLFTNVRNDFEDAGDNIDHIVAASATNAFDLATGGTAGHVYFVYVQEDSTPDFHMGITRYNGQTEQVERLNQSQPNGIFSDWTLIATDADDDSDFIDAKAISASTANVTGTPKVVVNSIDDVYVVYAMDDATPDSHIYMTRYDDSAGLIQGWDTATNGGLGGFDGVLPNCDEANDSLDAQIAAKDADTNEIVLDSNDNLYVAFLQEDATGNEDHIYLTRFVFETETVEYWSNDTQTWETEAFTQADATDMIDLQVSPSSSSALKMAADHRDDIYIAYIQQVAGGTNNHLKITRYDSSDTVVQGWDVDTSAFISDLTLIDPIDISTTEKTSSKPDIIVSRSGRIYIPYLQLGGQDQGSTTHLQLNTLIGDGDGELFLMLRGVWSAIARRGMEARRGVPLGK